MSDEMSAADAQQRIDELLARQADLQIQVSTMRLEGAQIKAELYRLAVTAGRADLASSLANAVAVPW